jgi:hypothetical protein
MKMAVAMAAVVYLSTTARAAEPQTLTLACEGARTSYPSKTLDTVSTGVIVNLVDRTVQGFGRPDWFGEVKVSIVSETAIFFDGSKDKWRVQGYLDRVTGELRAGEDLGDDDRTEYLLKCRPAQRLF